MLSEANKIDIGSFSCTELFETKKNKFFDIKIPYVEHAKRLYGEFKNIHISDYDPLLFLPFTMLVMHKKQSVKFFKAHEIPFVKYNHKYCAMYKSLLPEDKKAVDMFYSVLSHALKLAKEKDFSYFEEMIGECFGQGLLARSEKPVDKAVLVISSEALKDIKGYATTTSDFFGDYQECLFGGYYAALKNNNKEALFDDVFMQPYAHYIKWFKKGYSFAEFRNITNEIEPIIPKCDNADNDIFDMFIDSCGIANTFFNEHTLYNFDSKKETKFRNDLFFLYESVKPFMSKGLLKSLQENTVRECIKENRKIWEEGGQEWVKSLVKLNNRDSAKEFTRDSLKDCSDFKTRLPHYMICRDLFETKMAEKLLIIKNKLMEDKLSSIEEKEQQLILEKERIDNLNRKAEEEINTKKADVEDRILEIYSLKDRIALLESEINGLFDIQRDKDKEIAKLKEELEKTNEDKSELIALREFFYKSCEEQEDAPAEADYFDVLKDKKILIIGGHNGFTNKLKDKYPNWVFIESRKYTFPDNIITGVDLVVIVATYLDHSLYFKVMNVVKNHDIPFMFLDTKQNISLVENEIYNSLSDKNLI